MSSKSSVVNLYDVLTGGKRLQAKVSSDRADLVIETLPITITGTSVNIANHGGASVSNVVDTIVGIQQSVITEATARSDAVINEASLRVSGDAAVSAEVSAEVSARTTAMDNETATRVAAETVIANNLTSEIAARASAITSEISARSSADTTLRTAITSEATSRTGADSALQDAITTETSSRIAADISEATARDTAIASAINTEITARAAQDTVLQTNITAEANSRTAADGVLQTALDTEASTRATDVSAEATARAAADTTLQTNITAEATARAAADTTLQTNITAEATARGIAITAEANARTSADEELQANIISEQTDRLAEVEIERQRLNAILAGSSINLDTLLELVTAYSSADTSLLNQITSMSTSLTGMQAIIDSTKATVDTLVSPSGADETPNPGSNFTIIDLNVIQAIIDEYKIADNILQTNITAASASALQKGGGDLTGQVNTNQTPTLSTHIVPKSYVDTVITAERHVRLDDLKIERDKINAILDGASINLDTLLEVVNAYQLADTSVLSSITVLQNDAITESNTRSTNDIALQTNITAETTRAMDELKIERDKIDGINLSSVTIGGESLLGSTSANPNFKTKGLKAGSGVTFGVTNTDITLTNSLPSTLITLTSSGTGTSLLNSTTNPDFSTKGLNVSTGLSIADTANYITLTNILPSTLITLTSSGTGTSLLKSTTNPNFSSKGLLSTNGFEITAGTDDITLGLSTTGTISILQMSAKTFVLPNSAGTFSTTITSGATSNHSLILPTTQGAASTFLQNNGSGALSWASGSSGSSFLPSLARKFTTTGNITPTAGCVRIEVYITGGGGAGGAAASTQNNAVSSGGSSGATCYGIYKITGTDTPYDIVIGGSGVASTFSYSSIVMMANSGNAGITRSSATSNSSDQYPINSNPTVPIALLPATGEIFLGGREYPGTLGGYGIMVAADHGIAGYGGNSLFGTGGAGAIANTNTNLSGSSGTFGAGGGGSIQTSGNSVTTSGSGGTGVCFITEYF